MIQRKSLGFLALSVCGVLTGSAAGCTNDLSCGAGTVERNGQCVVAQPVSGCNPDAGDIVIDGQCVAAGVPPLLCGANTVYNVMTGRCEGTGGASDCSSTCEAPSSNRVCITGTLKGFIDNSNAAPTAQSGLKVRVYDPTAFVANPTTTPPLVTVDVETNGCFIAHDVPRPSSMLVAMSADDADTAMDVYATFAAGSVLIPNRNVTGQVLFYAKQTDVAKWQNDIGAGVPSGCPNGSGLAACGFWIGHYLDASNRPVTGARPSRPGDEPNVSNVFCFRGTRATLSTEDTTDDTGLCGISPDSAIETHTGACGTAGCTCNGAPCTPMFPQILGASATNVFFYEPFPATP
jgi:hypothetical protein